MSEKDLPIRRLASKTVFFAFMAAWLFAASPISLQENDMLESRLLVSQERWLAGRVHMQAPFRGGDVRCDEDVFTTIASFFLGEMFAVDKETKNR